MAVACEDVRLAYLDGTMTPEHEAHLTACSGCGFYAEMRGDLAPTTTAGPAASGSLHALLDGAAGGVLRHWRLEERIGGGGQGVVFRATDTRDDSVREVVAIKVMRFSPDGSARLAREVAIAHRVAHTNVCRVHGYELHHDLALIVMEYVADGSLADRLADRTAGPLTRAEAIDLFAQICDGVEAVHQAGALHLDLKPANVLLRRGTQPAVADFGMAVQIGEARIGGTRHYQPPEQAAGGEVDRRADVYALGKLLADLAGDRPGHLARVIARATAARPDDRYPDVASLRAALTPRRRGWRAPLIAAVALAGVLAAGTLAFLLVPPPRGPRAAWRAELWGRDEVPAELWNVARNRSGQGAPRVEATSHPMFACGSKPWTLFDGQAQYDNWEQGVAFAPPPTARHPDFKCEPFAKLDGCPDGIHDDHALCTIEGAVTDDDADYVVRPERVGERDRVPAAERAQLGQLVRRLPCGERWLVIDLGRSHRIEYVRLWSHGTGEVPIHYDIDAELPPGSGVWHEVFGTSQNTSPRQKSWAPGKAGDGIPSTARIRTVTARRLRLRLDTCSTVDAEHPQAGIGWLYEIEVFAPVSRARAWWRRIAGD